MRTSWTYTPQQMQTLQLSRSRLELFVDCQRCFWLLIRKNLKRPSMPAFTLNMAIDDLLKKEFDVYRKKGQPHPLMVENKLAAVPFSHPDLDDWRNAFVGVRYLAKEFNFLITGGVDDVWQDKEENLLVVDYKATSKSEPVKELNPVGSYHDAYRRQLEIYQWLLRKNDFKVSDTAYVVYATATRNQRALNGKLKFELNLIPHSGQTKWVDALLPEIKAVLEGSMPKLVKDENKKIICESCHYVWQRMRESVLAKKEN